MRSPTFCLILCLLLAPSVRAQKDRATAEWPAVTRDARPWTRWWWLGDAVDSAGITAQLRELSRAGFGGVEVTAIYGVHGADSLEVPYLSPRWVALIEHTVTEAKRLGMAVDLPPGSGWRMGGPRVTEADENVSLRIVPDSVAGGYRAVLRFSGDNVKRPAPGGEGRAIDVYSAAATSRYLADFADHTKAWPRGAIDAYFHDSFEYTGDASTELFAEFAKRRGYDLRTELAALAGRGDADHVARVKSDYRQTLDEMLLDNFLHPLSVWSHARGAKLREQAHGSPGNLLDLYAATDVPETEIYGPLSGTDADPLVNKFASSAAHLAGRPLASAESFTWLGEHFSTTLDDVKQAADRLFLTGIDHFVYHGTAYSPADAAWPGWEFYASVEFNPRNAFWRDLPAFNAYVTRVQSALQQGEADDDVLLYWPIWDNWHDTAGLRMDFRVHNPTWLTARPVGVVAQQLWNEGLQFDYVSDRLLASRVSVSGVRLRAGGSSYSVIVVPRTGHMPVDTFEKLAPLARSGATVIFMHALPADVPGLARVQERRDALGTAARRVALGTPDARGIRQAQVGRGTILVGDDLDALLATAGVQHDALALRGIGLLRQRISDGRQYFIVNEDTADVDEWVALPRNLRHAVLMDPMTGAIGAAAMRARDGTVEAEVQLRPAESVIVRELAHSSNARPWNYMRVAGSAVPLKGKWIVTFVDGGPALPRPFESDEPIAWTGRGDADADRFAGTARYTLVFDAPDGASDHVLSLGRVAESARVRLNGVELGTLIAHPFDVRTGPLRATNNRLEIEVTNISANRVRDLDRRGVQWKIFKDINYVNFAYKPFDASSWPVRASGVIGPVTIAPLGGAARAAASLTRQELVAIERRRVIAAATKYLNEAPITITATRATRSAGGLHDFYSEGDYWWPDPSDSTKPYIRRDGETNPDNFVAHRDAMRRLSQIVPALVAAYEITHDERYARHAIDHLRAWFVSESTRMNPNLQFAQAIQGVTTGRGTGIIDTIHLVEVAQAALELERLGALRDPDLTAIIRWFQDYITWMTTSKNGRDEKKADNNHSAAWALQVAAFARFAGDTAHCNEMRTFFKDTLLKQMAPDGSFPRELGRTKPYGYSLFQLDVMGMLAQTLSTPVQNMWAYETPDGRGMRRALAFMYPYIKNKTLWPKAPDVMYYDAWPIRHPSLLFGGLALQEPKYIALWKSLDPDPTIDEVIRNYPVRQPLLWPAISWRSTGGIPR